MERAASAAAQLQNELLPTAFTCLQTTPTTRISDTVWEASELENYHNIHLIIAVSVTIQWVKKVFIHYVFFLLFLLMVCF
jgi:hypothetical protein